MSTLAYFANSTTPRLQLTEPASGSQCIIEYLNEGGANFIYRIFPAPGTFALPSLLSGKLLRLRKDLPHVQSAKQQLEAFDSHFKPLFPEQNLVQHELIGLEPGLASTLNKSLSELNRPSHRLQDFVLADETHGLLVTDMTPQPGDVLLQIKAKWLDQSPSAPPDAKRCRTCALRAQRASRSVKTATDKQETCPLDLVSENLASRKCAAKAVTNDELLADYLVTEAQHLLHRLRSCQLNLDPHGVLALPSANFNAAVLDLCKAMTLRDCTLFLLRSGDKIDARLADLDLKLPEKLDRWKSVEAELVREGWYINQETAEFWKRENICALARP